MPGLIGRAYEQMGGTVHYVGKPYSAVYDRCLEILQVHTRMCHLLLASTSTYDKET